VPGAAVQVGAVGRRPHAFLVLVLLQVLRAPRPLRRHLRRCRRGPHQRQRGAAEARLRGSGDSGGPPLLCCLCWIVFRIAFAVVSLPVFDAVFFFAFSLTCGKLGELVHSFVRHVDDQQIRVH
jgi:hypothetical protein